MRWESFGGTRSQKRFSITDVKIEKKIICVGGLMFLQVKNILRQMRLLARVEIKMILEKNKVKLKGFALKLTYLYWSKENNSLILIIVLKIIMLECKV